MNIGAGAFKNSCRRLPPSESCGKFYVSTVSRLGLCIPRNDRPRVESWVNRNTFPAQEVTVRRKLVENMC